MQIMALGRNLAGEVLFPPLQEDALAAALADSLSRNGPALSRFARAADQAVALRGEVKRRVVDAGDPREAGWTFAVNASDPRRATIAEILRPLAVLRGMDAEKPLLFDGSPEDAWADWLQDNLLAAELEGRRVPRYILFAGGPRELPFRLQTLAACVASVGRVEFDRLEDLQAYVDKIIRLEQAAAPVCDREALLFATDGGPDDPTYFSSTYMVQPLANHIESELKIRASLLSGADATKPRLTSALGSKPAVVYTASHGLGLTDEPFEQHKAYNGAICCQAEGPLTLDEIFCADDVPEDGAFLEGAVFFQFACFGYGTPAESDYSHWLTGTPRRCTREDFIAALPKRLLAHPRGPIAYVGHVDTAFLHAFTNPDEPNLAERWSARMQPFVHAVDQLLGVQPSGLAMEAMNRKYNVSNAALTNAYDRQRRGTLTWTPDAMRRLVDSWIVRSDAQNYFVFGDPAARLRIPDA